MSQNRPLVSVIVPVYNASATLPLCLASLFNQTYSYLELIFVDDCSSDDSAVLINNYVANHDRKNVVVKLLHHENNQGVAAARNTAMDNADGDYICSVDADDWLEERAIETMVGMAEKNNSDIVGFDWYLSFDKNERHMYQRHFDTPLEGLEHMMSGVMRWNLWLFMVKRALYEDNHIRFVPGMNMGEDMLVTIRLFLAAESVSHIAEPLYHYRQVNDNAVSRTMSDTRIAEVTANVARVEESILESRYRDTLLEYMDYLKQFIKLPLLMSGDVTQYRKWSRWFPESDKSIMRNKMVPLRTRLIEYSASKRCYFIITAYYYIVYKFIYGIIYR